MSLRNNNEIMSSMLSRAATISFDPMVQHQRAQFNPSTGSWVFGLAAFAAGVALKKMIQPAGETPSSGANLPSNSPSGPGSLRGSDRGNSMKALLRDTMAEEGRSGDFLSSISSEVAKLREEVSALSAQREELKTSSFPHEYERSVDEYSEVKETLDQLNAEKARLARTEAELQQVLKAQQVTAPGATDTIRGDLERVQYDLDRLKQDQERIQKEYERSEKQASEARSAMDSLKQMLDEKVASLREAEFREENLKREHEILIETVSNLKKQLNFFREQAKQDQSGVTSLKILEESNSRLSAQVDTSLHEAEQQQAALVRLAAEKSELAEQLDEYRSQARDSEKRMLSLEVALVEAKSAERALLVKVEELSSQSHEAEGARGARIKLENDLAQARMSIQALEQNEKSLNAKLEMLVSQGQDISSNDEELLAVKAERDNLQQDLFELEKRSGNNKSELAEAAVKEEELNHKIESLLGQIKTLENERDLHKSRSEMSDLKVSNNASEFDVLKQSIATLESEKNSLTTELLAYQREASEAIRKQKEAEQLIRDSESKERRYRQEIGAISKQLASLEDSKIEFAAQQQNLQNAEAEIQHLLATRQHNEQELSQVNVELGNVKRELDALKKQRAKLDNEEQLSSGRVAQIEAQLRERDHLITDAKIKEDNLRSEVAVLQQTTQQLHGELERLREVQSSLGSSQASLSVLQETEQQLKSQLRNAQGQIEQQHQVLMAAQQEKARLEAGYKDESARFSNLQNENNFLRQQLAEWETKEAEHANTLLQLGGGAEDAKRLEGDLQQLRNQQLGLKSHLDSARNEKSQLEQNLNTLNGKLHHVVSERDHLSGELENVSVSLGSITAERDDLQNTCSKLQASIQELMAQQEEKNAEHKQALIAMEMQSIPEEVVVKELAVEEEPVVKLELPQEKNDGGLQPIGKLPERKDKGDESTKAAFVTEELDTKVFEPSVMNVEESESPVSENLFESSKVGRFRKFKGHRKIEDIEAKEKDLEERVKEYKDRLEKGESEEEIALSIAKSDSSTEEDAETKKKAYSPNRSFMDLLEDSERRKVEQKPVNVETTWSEVEELEEEDIVLEEGTNYKPLLIGGAAAGLAIGAAAMVLFNQNNNSSDPSKGNPITNNQQQNPNSSGGSSSVSPDNSGNSIDGDIDLSSVELKKKALDLLTKFHNSPDQNVRASLCRVPKRTLAAMKDYYSNRAQDYAVTDVEIDPQLVFESKMKFIRAKVKTELDGEEGSKSAYFVKDEMGNLKLDWYSYVGYEVTPWKKYLNLGDVRPEDWHVSIDLNGDEHPDYPEDKFVALRVRSWSPDAIDSASAYLSKENPMYQQLMDAYNLGQRTFILKVRHLGDITNSLYVDEVMSLSEFYVSDIEVGVSSSIDEISFGDSSY